MEAYRNHGFDAENGIRGDEVIRWMIMVVMLITFFVVLMTYQPY